ncbi:uncharacterized protein BO97DRAFT_308841, partial [Aspergillus homomorphus CBS 101889]
RSNTSDSMSDTSFNPMKADLDKGELKPGKRDRAFTLFLDLKHEYTKRFTDLLKEHVQVHGFTWGELLNSETGRRTCAEIFVDKHGTTYWGSEENRRKYLMPDALQNPYSLCTYPARREEIIRTVTILLERKAKGALRPSIDKDFHKCGEDRTSTDADAVIQDIDTPAPVKTIADMASNNTSSRKLKRKSRGISDEEYREADSVTDDTDAHGHSPPVKTEPHTSSDVMPTHSPISMEPPTSRKKRKFRGKKHSPQRQESGEQMSLDEPLEGGINTASTGTSMDDVWFLVTATSQEGMAPVWVRYFNFISTGTFIHYLRQECRLDDWSPSRQLTSDVSGHPTMKPVVVAASVKFEWTDFEIRVRQNSEEDWVMVQRELQKTMEGRTQLLEESESGSLTSAFKIRVLLHVV